MLSWEYRYAFVQGPTVASKCDNGDQCHVPTAMPRWIRYSLIVALSPTSSVADGDISTCSPIRATTFKA